MRRVLLNILIAVFSAALMISAAFFYGSLLFISINLIADIIVIRLRTKRNARPAVDPAPDTLIRVFMEAGKNRTDYS